MYNEMNGSLSAAPDGLKLGDSGNFSAVATILFSAPRFSNVNRMDHILSRRSCLIMLGANLLFWSLLAALRFPGPGIDDLFFVGTAVNLANGGPYYNPWTEQWNTIMTSGLFFFQPPFYSYVLAGWIKIFSVSTSTLVAFQCFWGFVFCVAGGGLVKRYRGPAWMIWLIPLIYAFNMRTLGFRPDAMTFALLVSGLWLLTKDRPWAVVAGFFLIGSSVLTLTVVIAYAVPLTAAVLWSNYQESVDRSSRYFGMRVAALVGAGIAVTWLFLVCIDFKLELFIHDYLTHAALRRDPVSEAPELFLKYSWQYWGYILTIPTYLLFVGLIGLALIRGPKPLPMGGKIWVVAAGVAIVSNIFLYVAGSVRYTLLISWMLIPFLWAWTSISLPKSWRLTGWGVIALVLLLGQTNNWPGFFFNDPEGKKENYAEIREFVRTNPDRKYAIDCVAAYEIFDYKLPKNTVEWDGQTKPSEPRIHLMTEKPSNVTWIVQTAILSVRLEDWHQDCPRVKVFGRNFNSLPLYPNQVSFFP